MLTQARLKELLDYDAETGAMRWRAPLAPRMKAGDTAGCLNSQGYLRVKVEGKNYQGHRLAWLWVHGGWPAAELDHRNGIRDDNRMANLREVTHAENLQNERKARPHSSTGILGIVRRRRGYQARITLLGQCYTIGTYRTPAEAGDAYQVVKAALHPFSGAV